MRPYISSHADGDVLEKERVKRGAPGIDFDAHSEEDLKEPPFYKVLLHNDDVTTMDFVVGILCRIFQKNPEEAEAIMLNVHNNGIGLCGIYTHEVAESKVRLVRRDAWLAHYPLKCTMEKE